MLGRVGSGDNYYELNESDPHQHLICSSCDPSSDIPHSMTSTRFRIANLCCAGEERIIRVTLEQVSGIEDISINVIGRYAVVKHCSLDCCAPSDKIVTLLNDQRLGASIQEANADDSDTQDAAPDYASLFHAFTVASLFLAAIVYDAVNKYDEYDFVGYVACTAIGLVPILYAAFISLIRLSIDIHILMLVAVVGAISSQEYLDAALVVTLFIIAELIEGEVMRRVRNAVKLGVSGMPKTATLSNGESILVDDLKLGDTIAVRAGDMILADGVVTTGQAVLDESALTGEAVPMAKKVGDKVISGTVVQNGYIEVEVTTDPRESTVRKLNEKVVEVQADRGKFAELVDRFAGVWTPAVLVAALALAVIAGGVTQEWHMWTHRALVLLVLACPCAIVIAAPIPSVCAVATAARHGVLIKGSSVVESLGVVNQLGADKTGTLTKGFFSVTESRNLADIDDDEFEEEYDPMALAAALESKSAHPLANAIVSAYCGCIADYEGKLPEVKKVQVMDGVGMQGWVEVGDDWMHIAVGNERLLKSHGGKVRPSKAMQKEIDAFVARFPGEMVLFVVIEDEIKAIMALADQIRTDAELLVQRMMRMHFSITMLTGDHEQVARQVCNALSIPPENCKARLLPHEKLHWIISSQVDKQGKKTKQGVIMLGDGINDATALAASRVGVAMGAGGSAMAVAAADVVILSNNLLRLPSAVSICRTARTVIVQNCVFAIAIKLAAIVMAILGMLTLWQAVLIDVGSLLFVVANGSSLLFSRAFEDSDAPDEPERMSAVKEIDIMPPIFQE